MISVIVPIYNCARFLSRTFSCLEAQTNQDFELILIMMRQQTILSLFCTTLWDEHRSRFNT